MTLRVTVVVGNPKPQSRTLTVSRTLAEAMFGQSDSAIELIDLADHSTEVLLWPSGAMDHLTAQVASSDVAIFATPTYKASYTGLLKSFLDRYSNNGLAGVVAIPLMTGADKTHSMGPALNLAPLLVELGAVVPGRGLYFVIDQLDRVDEIVGAAAETYADNLARLAKVSEFCSRRH